MSKAVCTVEYDDVSSDWIFNIWEDEETHRVFYAAEVLALRTENAALRAELQNCRDERNKELGRDTLTAVANINAAAVSKLKAENARLQALAESLAKTGGQAQRTVAHFRDALEKYADRHNWEFRVNDMGDDVEIFVAGNENGWTIAAEALASKPQTVTHCTPVNGIHASWCPDDKPQP